MSAQLYTLPRNLVLAASAGTGKTHALVGVVVHLLVGARAGGPVDPSRIVATTFSRKAAFEIKTRVFAEIERLADDPSSSRYVAGVREALGNVSDTQLVSRARRARERLAMARFGTLHSFAMSIVEKYALELGLGPGFELVPEADARARIDDAIAHALERRLESAAEPLRALAEAAGGIDRLVIALRRVLAQLEEDGRPARELQVDASDVPRVEAQMRELLAHARAISGHPRAEDAAREMASAWDSSDADRIERAAAALTALPATGKKTPELEAFFAFRAELPGARNDEKGRRLARLWRVRDAFGESAALVRDVLAEAEAEIERVARAHAALGFGEILRAARELLRERPDVADEVGASIDALLVDEFQDTSRVQRDLLQLLWARPEARPRAGTIPPLAAMRGTGLLVVGDRKQSIYGFRGADVGVFAELAVGLAGAPAREALGIPAGVTWEPQAPLADFHALRHNRRSVPAILAFANAFSARRFQIGEPPPELYEIAYSPSTEDLLVPDEEGEKDEGGHPLLAGSEHGEAPREFVARRVASEVGAPRASELATFEPRATWLRVRPKGNSSTRLEEALVIAAHIPKLGRAYRDVAVLATTNGMLDAAAFALAQAAIPYVVSGKSFFRTREVSDLAAMLALILEPSDRLALLEVLRGPWAGVHDETLLGLVEPGKGLVSPSEFATPPNAALVHDEDRPSLDAVAGIVASLARCSSRLGPGALLREAIAALDLELVLGRLPRGEQRVANVHKLLSLADRHTDARAFLRWLQDAKEQELSESEAATFSDEDDAVRLLTVHASKGLDFKVVFVPEIGAGAPVNRGGSAAIRVQLGAGDAPNILSLRLADAAGLVLSPPSYERAQADTKRRERAERQRLAYVAMTRAAEAIYLVGGRTKDTVLDPGASTLAVIESLPPELVIVEDADVPMPSIAQAALDDSMTSTAHKPRPRRPAHHSLPIAPTALADFAHCPRRFELVHVLGLPEHARGGRGETDLSSGPLDARARGTLAHLVLERLPIEAFLTPENAQAVSSTLANAGVPESHPQHTTIAARARRFLETTYARSIGERGGTVHREVAFVVPIDRVLLRGSMDLVVTWRDAGLDVIDYKSARSGNTESYALQLDIYSLAAGAYFPNATTVRAGLSFLGGGSGEPVWRAPDPSATARIAKLGDALMEARWSDHFPRVEIERCESIHCGFIGRCHPER
jgi:ATP-dependent helicase/nuclease subunit A